MPKATGLLTRSFRLLSVPAVLASLLYLSTGLVGQNQAGGSRQPSLAGGDWPHYTGALTSITLSG